jgi:NTE family protein/lysophospholipid hydrolase
LRGWLAECKGLETVRLAKGETLFREAEPADALYIVNKGQIAETRIQSDGTKFELRKVGLQEFVGELEALTGERRHSSAHATRRTKLTRIPRSSLHKLALKKPELLKDLAQNGHQQSRNAELVLLLSQLLGPMETKVLREISTRAEWISLTTGDLLFQQGDRCESLYFVVSGRLQSMKSGLTPHGGSADELSRGDLIGECALVEGVAHSASLLALRDSEVARFPKPVVEEITDRYPDVMGKILRILVNRMQRTEGSSGDRKRPLSIAVLPIHSSERISKFAERLRQNLATHGSTIKLESHRLDAIFGQCDGLAQVPRNDPDSIRLSRWLDQQEAEHDVVIYQADDFVCPWTKRCLERADQIILVAEAGTEPSLSEIECEFLGESCSEVTARRALVLLHPDGDQEPTGTQEWLVERDVISHHHLRWDNEGDFARLGRILTGRAIGLVLSGGGARGFAHIGAIRALEEAGIPIDFIGGTSMGAVIGAQYAQGFDVPTMLRENKIAFVDVKPFRDYTLPIVSLSRNRRLDYIADYAYGNRRFEDLWINFFCISSNLTDAELVVHNRGPLAKMVKASGSLPGVALPVVENGKLLVDGGLFNNLPCDIMRQMCQGTVIAVNSNSPSDLMVDERYQEIPSPWRILWSRLNPFSQSIKTPSIVDIMRRTASLAGASKEKALTAEADICLTPPVAQFGLLDFPAIREIAEAGYEYAKEELEKLKQNVKVNQDIARMGEKLCPAESSFKSC